MDRTIFISYNCRMKVLLLVIFSGIVFSSSAQLPDSQVRDAKSGRLVNDTSYIYQLPWESGKRHLLIQAANSQMSHKNELSLDFKMKIGTPVCAARDGTVLEVKADSDTGGLQEDMLSQGNHIVILHTDGTKAKYWHLQKDGVFINPGDDVAKGQLIGASGNTGYTAFAHLHFQVVDKNGRQLLTRFLTRKGVIYLRPGKWYCSKNTAAL